MRALALALFTAAAAAAAPPGTARAEAPDDVVRLEVLPGWRVDRSRHMAALRLTLAPGWKTYWRAPGAAGLAPAFDLRASAGVAAAEAHWPVPEVFHQRDERSIGYGGQVTIPLELALSSGPARLSGEVEIGVCRDVCVPVRRSFAVDLPAGGQRDPAIVAALVDRPLTAAEAGARATCGIEPRIGSRGGDALALTIRIALPPLGPDEVVVIESADPGLWVSEPAAARRGGELVAVAEAIARDGGPVALDRGDLRITVLGEGQAVDIRGCEADDGADDGARAAVALR